MRSLWLATTVVAALGLTVTAAQAQTPAGDAKRPGVAAQSSGNITNIQVVDPDLVRQGLLFKDVRDKPSAESATLVPWLIAHSSELQPAFLYELARRLWDMGREDEALDWYALAFVRARYDAFRCVDATAPQGIMMLPTLAPNIQAGVRQNPVRFGEAGQRALGRSDVFASKVSPWWICSHGMAAVRAGMEHRTLETAAWLKPEGDWESLRSAIKRDLSAMFADFVKPQEDPIPMSKRAWRTTDFGPGRYGDFAWLDADRLVIQERLVRPGVGSALRLWRRNGGTSGGDEIARFQGPWCAGNGVIAYRKATENTGGKTRRETFVSGAPGAWKESTMTFAGNVRYPAILHHQMNNWSLAEDPARQSPFDCRWVRSEVLSGPDMGAEWIPLLPGHGFLSFVTPAGNKGFQKPERIHYRKTETAAPIELPIAAGDVRVDSVRWFAFRKAYFVSPTVLPPKGNEPKPACIPVWWFDPATVKTEETCVPVDALNASTVVYAPSKAGLLRTISGRRTPSIERPGGIYLHTPDGRDEKIFEAKVQAISVSPDGCAVAVHSRTDSVDESSFAVIELCGAASPAGAAKGR